MCFKHVGNAGGGVAVLRGELVEERLGIVVNSGITAKLRACAWWRTLVRQEPQDRIRVGRFELLWQTEERVYWQVVWAKYRQESVLSFVHVGKRLALPGLVDDAAVAAATKGAGPITSTEVPEPLGSGAHGQALRRKDRSFGRRRELGGGSSVSVLVKGGQPLESGAVGGEELGMRLSGKSIDHGTDVLVGDVHQVESKVGRTSDGEVGSDVAAVFCERSDEQAHRPRSTMTLAGPLTPACSTTRRAGIHVRRRATIRDGPEKAQLLIGSDGTLKHINGPRMLRKDPSRK